MYTQMIHMTINQIVLPSSLTGRTCRVPRRASGLMARLKRCDFAESGALELGECWNMGNTY